MVEKLADMGWIYNKIKLLLEESKSNTSLGTINNAFCRIIDDELNEYYRLIAILEAQVNYDLLSLTNPSISNINNKTIQGMSSSSTEQQQDSSNKLTLRKLYIILYNIYIIGCYGVMNH